MKLIYKIPLFLFLINSVFVFSEEIKISLFNDYTINTLVVTSLKGEYNIISGNDTILTLQENNLMYLSLISNKISIRGVNKKYGVYVKINMRPVYDSCVCKLMPVLPSIKERHYEGDLSFSIDYNRILIINEINIDKYLAGVVEAEGGSKASMEYYKAQSLLCRTYAIKNYNRHIEEGFNLCDGVHCQAFKGKSERNPEIIKATKTTSGLVIEDQDSNLITAVFHANCGGETQNSNNIWLVPQTYLKSVIDPFCLNKSSSKWQKKIPIIDWKIYLKKNNFHISNNTNNQLFVEKIKHRKNYYTIANDSIAYNRIRKDWDLRSSFFSVVIDGEYVELKGRGYGHGVGLCQIGAMEMSKKGYSYKDIIDFYYYNVNIVNEHPIAY